MSITQTIPKGGSFLVRQSAAAEIFTPEEFDHEARMIGQTAEDFIRKEVFPIVKRLDEHEHGLLESLFAKMAELGLLAIEIPPQYGGLWLDKTTVALVIEKLGAEPSMCLTHQAHAGLATLPMLFTGTAEQKAKYLPKLASGEWGASYCLSEPNSGSDALGAQTRAVPSADGKTFTLNGSKMWVTNASFAKLFTVFAKLDGAGFTGFLVERDTPGLEPAREEDKIGLKGSSTRRVQLENVVIPAENLLGEPGRGHTAAFNTLNMGRFKMSASSLGAGKYALATSAAYANQREQFQRPISSFGLMQHKLAEMQVRLFALESMIYRTAGYINGVFHEINHDAPDVNKEYIKAASEYSIECSIIKVFGTETQSFCTDEGLQIHGGYGYTEDFPIARQFRDGRIPRVYEGTNEINRMVIAQMLLKRADAGEISLSENPGLPQNVNGETVEALKAIAANLKSTALFALAKLQKKYGKENREQQEELASASDIVILAYGVDSLSLRLDKMKNANHPGYDLTLACAQVYAQTAVEEARIKLQYLLSAQGAQSVVIEQANHLLPSPYWNLMSLRRLVAAEVIKQEKYLF